MPVQGRHFGRWCTFPLRRFDQRAARPYLRWGMTDSISSPADLSSLLDRAADAVARARRAGADAAEAVARRVSSLDVGVRLGVLEDVGRSEDSDIALRLFVGQRSASVSTADASAETLDALVERAVAMARLAPENPWAGLAPEELLMRGPAPDLDLADPLGEPAAERLRDLALAVEDAARAVPGVTNSEGGSASAGVGAHALVTSHGFAGASLSTSYGLSASVLAGEGERMQRDYDWHGARHFADLEAAEAIGRRAGQQAVARLDPASLKSGAMPVLFDPRVAGSLIGHLVGGMSGAAIAQRKSFLLEHERARLFPDAITITDDPLRPRGMKSRAFDGEGLPTRAGRLVDAGVIAPWLCDSAAARQLGRQPNGGGLGTGNLTLLPGALSRAALMADVAHGVLVTELIGQGVNPITGDYSRGASGWLIRDGVLAGPVAGFTIAGNLLAMFAELRAADDLDTRHTTHVPTLRTDSMTVAGD
jgi:PmbA protein